MKPQHEPVPADLGAEHDMCSLLLRGETTPERLLPVEPKHYHSAAHARVHEAAKAVVMKGGVVEFDTIAERLASWGVPGDFRQDLEEIRAFSPLLTAQSLETTKLKLVELWGRRRLIEALSRTESALRIGDIDCAAARARLEDACREVTPR